MFSIFDDNNNGIDITSSLSDKEKMMTIKNTIGHDNVVWRENEFILIND